MFAQETSLAGQFVQLWKLRMRAREVAAKEVANSKLRRLFAYNESFNCADINLGGSALFHKAQNRKSPHRWLGPATILDIDEAAASATFQSQTFKAARYCVRKHLKEIDVSDEEWKNSLHRGDPWMGQRPAGVEVA